MTVRLAIARQQKSKNEYLLRSLMITRTRNLAFNLMTILRRNEDGKFNTLFEDGSYEQMVYNNPNTDLSPAELETLVEDEINERHIMAMGKDYVPQNFA